MAFRAADDLLALTNTETPLKGGENNPLHSTDFTAPSSIRAGIQTPNTVLAAIGQTPRTNYEQTPGTVVSATPGATPFRDQLNINKEAQRASVEELRQQLKTLPTPKNDFEVVMPEDEVKSDEEDFDMEWVEDAGELDSKRASLLEKKKQKELALRSEVFRRDLPKPSKLNDSFFKRYPVKNEYDEADNLIRAEMRNILRYDVNGTLPADNFTFEELRDASILIDSEARKRGEFDEEEYMQRAIAQTSGRQIFYNGRFVTVDEIPRKERSKALATEIEKFVVLGKQIKSKTEKVQNKVKVILQGFEKIQETAINTIQTNQHDFQISGMEVETFRTLQEYEVNAANLRVQNLTKEVNEIKEDEAALQKEYSDLMHQQWEINQKMLRKQATTEGEAITYSNGNTPAENQQ
uniref:Pre-mRNA splicing factor component Cdc5p/Cef1 C-terminal domain-containing protein n=1 Tax=Panagrolaimus superbus TaxID=310955 RepID=A0A914YZ85_9BILA